MIHSAGLKRSVYNCFVAGPIKASKLVNGKVAQSTRNEEKFEFTNPLSVKEHVAAG